MPDINITLSEDDYRMLSDEYRKKSIEWLRNNSSSVPPPLEQWLAAHIITSVHRANTREPEVEEIHAINALEKLVTSLQQHGFGLAHIYGAERSESIENLTKTVAGELGLSLHGVKRLRELLDYYSKSAKEVADAAHVAVTNRAYGALHEAYRELVQRTEKAADHLGEDRALGRVEGAVAILVNLQVMTREAAKEKTEVFRLQMHSTEK